MDCVQDVVKMPINVSNAGTTCVKYHVILYRNINYENLEGFLCNECGYSKWGQFSYSLTAKRSFGAEKIENDEDKKKAMEIIDKESDNAYNKYQEILQYKNLMLQHLQNINQVNSLVG